MTPDSPSAPATPERIETSRDVPAPAADVFALLCDPQGHVAIDSSGMLQDATAAGPITSETALRGTLGILDRTVRRG